MLVGTTGATGAWFLGAFALAKRRGYLGGFQFALSRTVARLTESFGGRGAFALNSE